MKRLSFALSMIAIGAFCSVAAISALAQAQQVLHASEGASVTSGHPLKLNGIGPAGNRIHVLPTHEQVKGLSDIGYAHNGGTPPLLYNGGPVMHNPSVYAIFWIPPHLQDNHATSLSSGYQTIEKNMLTQYFGHSLMNNNTQYYDTTSYIANSGKFAASYVDKSLYPGSDCYDPAVLSGYITNGNNCISDTDLQNEVNKVMLLKGWTGGVNKMFMVFTSSDEGQCYASGSSCSYYTYCAYHSYFINGSSQYVIYGNEPYGVANICQVPGAPSPNANAAADIASTAAAHELTESITDPLIDAWLDSSGAEIGDECAYYYGIPLWDGGNATNQWNGHNFYLQTMYDNLGQNYYTTDINFTGCFNVGPEL